MALKVFDLQCSNGHLFEGWFASHEDYDRQQAQGLLSCPVCENPDIARRLSAPRINLGKTQPPADRQSATRQQAEPPAQQQQAQLLQRLRDIVKNTDNVGTRFPEEARRMHSGEIPERAIRGTATPQEREALAEEGIDVLPVPAFLDDDRLQ